MQDHSSPRADSRAEAEGLGRAMHEETRRTRAPTHVSDHQALADAVRENQRVLGRAVRELRARRGLSQELLGEQADMHRNYIGAIERGEVNATFRVLVRVAAGLDVPLSLLVRLYERRREEP